AMYILCTESITMPCDCSSWFSGYTALTTLEFNNIETSSVTSMVKMFYNCSALTSLDLSKFNTANTTDMN
ncbi:MAG: BspA family leucine-rich repeat surface protein, partial [Clostridia bacterium]|nr:BspA family leucine-rich repeat surface protein [Clostridia bacterium]